LDTLVRENAGKNCVELLVKALAAPSEPQASEHPSKEMMDVWTHIGNVIDNWEQLPNDIRMDTGFDRLDKALSGLYHALRQPQASEPEETQEDDAPVKGPPVSTGINKCRACGGTERWCSVYTSCPLNKGGEHDMKQYCIVVKGHQFKHQFVYNGDRPGKHCLYCQMEEK
jgi:hypothetical protein